MVRISASEDSGSSDRLSTLLHRCLKMYTRACHLLTFFRSLLRRRPHEACKALTLLGSHSFPSCCPDICTQSCERTVYCPPNLWTVYCPPNLWCSLWLLWPLPKVLALPLGSQAVSYSIFQSQCIQQFFRGASSPLLMCPQPLVIPPSSLLPHSVAMAVPVSPVRHWALWGLLVMPFSLSLLLWHRTINWGCTNYDFVKIRPILNCVE